MAEYRKLWQLNASEMVAGIQSGEFTALDLTEAAIKRLEAINPSLNAIVEPLIDQAIADAKSLDQSVSLKGSLHGVPVTIKINIDQTGHATSNGVTAYKDIIASQDAPVVKNLKEAGAVIIGRTNTPEFSFRADTDNDLFGRTHNPWGRHVSPGGSSGGAGAAVMSGIGALAHGNDIGGSLRFPASANGAVTIKPGLGRVPVWNSSQTAERGMLSQSMSVQGLLARNASDLHLAMPALISADPRDPFHVPLSWRGEKPNDPIRVAFTRDDFGFGTHPAIEKALTQAATALSNAGYIIHEVEPPLAKETGEIGYRTLLGETKQMLQSEIEEFGSATVNSIFAEYFRQFPPFEGDELLRMFAKRSYYAREWSLFLDKYPLVLTPFMLKPFFAPGRDTEGTNGVRDVLGHSLWSFVASFTGLPAGCLPTNIAQLETGPQPIGIQIIGRRWREDLIVDAMQAIERKIPPVCNELWARMQA